MLRGRALLLDATVTDPEILTAAENLLSCLDLRYTILGPEMVLDEEPLPSIA
jgi:hypothetical protein